MMGRYAQGMILHGWYAVMHGSMWGMELTFKWGVLYVGYQRNRALDV